MHVRSEVSPFSGHRKSMYITSPPRGEMQFMRARLLISPKILTIIYQLEFYQVLRLCTTIVNPHSQPYSQKTIIIIPMMDQRSAQGTKSSMIFLIARSLSADSRINIAFGILAFILSLVSIIVGVATWRVHHRATTHTDGE